ncbi:hypothetical protein F3Y22_tig00001120pilonHSYRG00099 [Hibiscus syriacus]|uniref:Uncharacterized protein n=1 Tax=Hibiscus syriacus TaxID=106335 RepID=A0A6A3CVZ3_HIBSY|nr:hypothetical protein F3Y22_tig00001120pilonHSYRG00099 [Hibiscus syriacus]
MIYDRVHYHHPILTSLLFDTDSLGTISIQSKSPLFPNVFTGCNRRILHRISSDGVFHYSLQAVIKIRFKECECCTGIDYDVPLVRNRLRGLVFNANTFETKEVEGRRVFSYQRSRNSSGTRYYRFLSEEQFTAGTCRTRNQAVGEFVFNLSAYLRNQGQWPSSKTNKTSTGDSEFALIVVSTTKNGRREFCSFTFGGVEAQGVSAEGSNGKRLVSLAITVLAVIGVGALFPGKSLAAVGTARNLSVSGRCLRIKGRRILRITLRALNR